MTGLVENRSRFSLDKGGLGLIHTVGSLQGVFSGLAEELLPNVEVTHSVDESLLKDAIAEGGVTSEIEARLAALVAVLSQSGVDAIMVTCSSMGEAVDRIAAKSNLPVLRVDTAMIDEALRTGKRVGVLATLGTTMMPTVELVRQRSNRDASVQIEEHLCQGAFEALKAADVALHDELVRGGLRRIRPLVDVIILAQASMARAVAGPGFMSGVPILSSPRLAMQAVAQQYTISKSR
jgi:aspartate/glutamate racemase